MNTIVIFAIAIASFFLGAIIAWIIGQIGAKGRSATMQAKLEAGDQLLTGKQQEISEAIRKWESVQQQLGEARQLNAAFDKQVEFLSAALEDSKKLVDEKSGEIQMQQRAITDAIELKAKAEAALTEINKTVIELHKREQDVRRELEDLQRELIGIREENATLYANATATMARLQEQKQFVEEAQRNLKDAFGTLSASALQNNNTSFVELAKAKLEEKVTEAKSELEMKHQAIDAMVKPLSESLTKMDEKINALETKREGAYSQMHTLLDQMKQSTLALDKETRSLVTALKSSTTRGRYGEIALRRLVEFAGMLEHCDFEEQVSTEGETGRLRPDMIIRLPEHRQVVVDSKVPLAAYLEIFETEDPNIQKQLMDKHIVAIKAHLKQLGSKAYWDQFSEAPDFVVMFMQIESSFGAALQVWPGMIEEALNNRIIIATPTTLITILRSIGYGWNQLRTIENIEEIRDAAVDLYERSATLMDHMTNIGKSLTGTVNHYNKAVGSLEGSFLPQGRRISQLAQGFVKKTLADMSPLEVNAREIVAIAPPTSSTQPLPSDAETQ